MIYSIGMEYLSLEELGKGLARRATAEGKTDEELLALSVRHPSLFALLVRKYEAPFLRKAQEILRDAQDAEDVVQETFTKIYINARKFKMVEGAQFSSWGYRILINTALTHYARAKRRGQATVRLDDEIWQLIPDKNLRQFERMQFTDEVASVLARMPAPLARALASFFLEGKSQEEIAAQEGLSVGAVKTRVHRAKAEFRRVYETFNPKN